MPLNKKGRKIVNNMKKEYGKDKGEKVFYGSVNAGKIKDVEGAKKKKPRKKTR